MSDARCIKFAGFFLFLQMPSETGQKWWQLPLMMFLILKKSISEYQFKIGLLALLAEFLTHYFSRMGHNDLFLSWLCDSLAEKACGHSI